MKGKKLKILLTTITASLLLSLSIGGAFVYAQDTKEDPAALFERTWAQMKQAEDLDEYFLGLPKEIQDFMISELSHVEVRVKVFEIQEERGT